MTRYAPLQSAPDRFGITTRPRHHGCYDVLWSETFRTKTGFDLDDYCYYFERNFSFSPRLSTLYKLIIDEINHWKSQLATRPVWPTYEPEADGRLHISDARFGDADDYLLSTGASRLYLACANGPTNLTRLSTDDSALAELTERRLLWREGDLTLGLAIPAEITRERLDSGWIKEWPGLYV